MTEQIAKNSFGLSLLGLMAGVMAILFFLAFHYTSSNDSGSSYYLGAFFTSLNVTVLCLSFAKVYDLLKDIMQELQRDV